jgi:hypothetical protein
MLVFDYDKFRKGLENLKECDPFSEFEKEVYKIMIMLETGQIDYNSFDAATLKRLLEEYYYQDKDELIEEKLSLPGYLAERIKNIPRRPPDADIFF